MEHQVVSRLADGGLLERVVRDLREIDRQTGLERVLSIGELILTVFFGGDPAVWRSRRRNKGNSIRRLAEREDCPYSKSALNEAVAVYVAVSESPCVRTFGQITAGHVAAVLPLRKDEREQLLARANDEGLSVRGLRNMVVDLRRASGERRGRPRSTEQERLLSSLFGAERRLGAKLDELVLLGNVSEVQRDLVILAERLSQLEYRFRTLSRAALAPSRDRTLPAPMEASQ